VNAGRDSPPTQRIASIIISENIPESNAQTQIQTPLPSLPSDVLPPHLPVYDNLLIDVIPTEAHLSADAEYEDSGTEEEEDDGFDEAEFHEIPDFAIFHDGLESQQLFVPSDDEDNADVNDEFLNFGRIDLNVESDGWSSKTNIVFNAPKQFNGLGSEGPKNIPENTESPMQFWNLFISLEMIRSIVLWTNDYADKWKAATPNQIFDSSHPRKNMFPKQPRWLTLKRWKPVTDAEIRCFIAIQCIMGFVKPPNLKAYWDGTKKYFNVFSIRDIMSRFRFSQIKSCFHIFKATNGEQLDDNADKLAKVREFFDKISNCQNYYNPHEILSLDEILADPMVL
jgi:hypothetical protein